MSGFLFVIFFYVVMFVCVNWLIFIVYGSLYDKLNFICVFIGFYEICYLYSVVRYNIEVCVFILFVIVFKKIKFFVVFNLNFLELFLFLDFF